jgi:hypothetical protein
MHERASPARGATTNLLARFYPSTLWVSLISSPSEWRIFLTRHRTHRVSELPTAAFRLVCRMGGAMLRNPLCQPMPPAWRQQLARTFGVFLPAPRGIVAFGAVLASPAVQFRCL